MTDFKVGDIVWFTAGTDRGAYLDIGMIMGPRSMITLHTSQTRGVDTIDIVRMATYKEAIEFKADLQTADVLHMTTRNKRRVQEVNNI